MPDEAIHDILNEYTPEQLGPHAERAVQELRTSIFDQLPKNDPDVSIQLYLLRHSHTIGSGNSVLIVNITEDNMFFQMRSYLNDYMFPSSDKSKKLILKVLKIIKQIFCFIAAALGIVAAFV